MSNDLNKSALMNCDRPIVKADSDMLGFPDLAKKLAKSIVSGPKGESIVFGIEGAWGSGKTSLMKLTIEALKEQEKPPEIVEFAPWLIKDRDTLLWEFFKKLLKAAGKDDKQREKLAELLSGFAALSQFAGSVSQNPMLIFVGTLASGISKKLKKQPPLDEQKEKIVCELRKLPGKIIVFIDDLDRLDPQEAIEVLRLVRAVADFPNVIYVLAYDADVVCGMLERNLHIESGRDYLEKITQVSFKVPLPEAFVLTQLAGDHIYDLFKDADQLKNEEVRRRLGRIVGLWGDAFLRTMRDIHRLLNALRLYAVPVVPKIDIPDMVWLQIARLHMPDFYKWTESYLAKYSELTLGDGDWSSGQVRISQNAKDILNRYRQSLTNSMLIDLNEILPRFKAQYHGLEEGNEISVITLSEVTSRDEAVIHRLKHPVDYRTYFAFDRLKGYLSPEQALDFIRLAKDDARGAESLMKQYVQEILPTNTCQLDWLMRRISDIHRNASSPDRRDSADSASDTPDPILSESHIVGLLKVFANCMDDCVGLREENLKPGEFDFMYSSFWRVSFNLARNLLLYAESTAADKADFRARMEEYLTDLFTTGQSIGWLVSLLDDDEIEHKRRGEARCLPQACAKELIKRLPESNILEHPVSIGILTWWHEKSEPSVREWVATRIETDLGLLLFLEKMRSYSMSSDGISSYLRAESLNKFLDIDSTKNRLSRLKDDRNASEEDKARAVKLLNDFERDHG